MSCFGLKTAKTEASFFLDDPTLGGHLCHETKRGVHAAHANCSQERPQRGLVLGKALKRIEQILIDFKRLIKVGFYCVSTMQQKSVWQSTTATREL